MAKYRISVATKSEVLDPEAKAIQRSLETQGVTQVRDVIVEKSYILDCGDKNISTEALKDLAEGFFSNPVGQSVRIEVL